MLVPGVAEQVACGQLGIVLADDEDPQGRRSVPKIRAFTDFVVPRLKKPFAY